MDDQVTKFVELAKQLIATGEVFINISHEITEVMNKLAEDDELVKEVASHPEAKQLADKLEEVQLKLIDVII